MANLSNINNKFLVTTTGEVLIGQTANNGNRLQITGADGASYIYLKTDVATTGGRIGFNGDALRVFNQQASGDLSFGTAGTERMKVDSAGDVTIQTSGADDIKNFTINSSNGSSQVAGFIIQNDGANGYIHFKAGSGNVTPTTRLTIGNAANSGNVGIGTDSPGEKLEVNGNIQSLDTIYLKNASSGVKWQFYRDGSETLNFRYNNGTAWNSNAISIKNDNNVGIGTTSSKTSLDIVKDADIWHLMVGGGTKKLLIGGQGANGITIQGGAASTPNNAAVTTPYNISLQRDGGNVGIGTDQPLHKLSIRSTDNTRGILINNTSTASYAELHLKANREYRIGTGGSATAADAANNFYVYDTTAGLHRLTLLPSGNVGIGSYSPSKKLEVVGDIGVRIDNKIGWIYDSAGDTNMYNYLKTANDGAGQAASHLEISGANWTSGNTASVKFTHVNGGDLMTIMTGGNVGIGTNPPTQKLDVNGLVKHLGLDMTAGIQVDQTTSITKTLNGAAGSWLETGIDGSDIGNNGSYMIQIYSNTQGGGASNYSMYWTGVMSWYYTGTNSGNTSEIYLNSAGHYRGMDLELRTISSVNSATPPSMRIQFKSNQTLTNMPNWVFKFRRLM